LRTNEGKRYLSVAIDRTSKFAVAQLVDKANRKKTSEFLKAVLEAVPYKVHTILTDNGIQFCEQYHYENHNQLRMHLSDFFDACNYARRLKNTQWSHAFRIYLQNLDI
jgi:hypothetical protein